MVFFRICFNFRYLQFYNTHYITHYTLSSVVRSPGVLSPSDSLWWHLDFKMIVCSFLVLFGICFKIYLQFYSIYNIYLQYLSTVSALSWLTCPHPVVITIRGGTRIIFPVIYNCFGTNNKMARPQRSRRSRHVSDVWQRSEWRVIKPSTIRSLVGKRKHPLVKIIANQFQVEIILFW